MIEREGFNFFKDSWLDSEMEGGEEAVRLGGFKDRELFDIGNFVKFCQYVRKICRKFQRCFEEITGEDSWNFDKFREKYENNDYEIL